MDLDLITRLLGRVHPRMIAAAEKTLQAIPPIHNRIEEEYDGLMGELESTVKPYKDQFPVYSRIPQVARERAEIIGKLEELRRKEESRWKEGFVSGAVYHGDEGHINFLNEVYAINSQSNPLHSDIWPSTAKFEAEIAAMTANMLGAAQTNDEICGTVSSGGTESILLAMKTYRDRARERQDITAPEMIIPSSAHAAFDKAAQYFNIKPVRIPVGADYRANVDATRRAINKNTIVLVGSTPCFPHGEIDPITELSELARAQGIGFHTDACLGGFVLPWAEKLGYDIPAIDFRLPGVTSMSADTHKYGYAPKGTSVVLYRGRELRRYQYYTATDWPGGIYFSPTFGGSRPGALSAGAWAALLSIGERGYLQATKKILETAAVIKKGVTEIPGLHILGDPLWVIAFASKELDIYKVMDRMAKKRWSLNGLHRPPALHICVTLRHTQPGVADRFIADLGRRSNTFGRIRAPMGEWRPFTAWRRRSPCAAW